jgi:hypothetical protein
LKGVMEMMKTPLELPSIKAAMVHPPSVYGLLYQRWLEPASSPLRGAARP